MTVPWRERSPIVRRWRLLRTRHPVTFNEKIRYKMLRDHRPLLVTWADKAAVRDYVASMVGERYLPRLYGILSDPAALWTLQLPDSWVVKPTHGSGAVVAVRPGAPADAVLPSPHDPWTCREVSPSAIDRQEFQALGRSWLARVHGRGPNHEWAYSALRPRLLVEEHLGIAGRIPDDHKLFVFHGRCQYVQVVTNRFGVHTEDFFLPSWERLPLHAGSTPWAATMPTRPERLDEMIAVAERLGDGTDFVRVDLYALPDHVVFGELTSYPAGGRCPFAPEHFDVEFGRHWSVPRRYR